MPAAGGNANATERVTKYPTVSIPNTWRDGADYDCFLQSSPRGYALGVNAVRYALTH
jgi:hypothetical protein